jgi:hypothetical protein
MLSKTPPARRTHRPKALLIAKAELRPGVSARLRELLSSAQRAGAVRADVGYDDVKALTAVALMRPGVAAALDPVVAVVCDGLRARPT